MLQYYDGTKLLSLMDADGRRPEIYICTTNRSAGKTTFFGRYCMNRFFKYGEKFMLLYRFQYELDNISDKFFKDIGTLFFPEYTMSSIKRAKGIYHELFLTKGEDSPVNCGYAVALNSADQIKKYSHFFADVSRLLFDEFQSEVNRYCNDEVRKFISIHTSVARGQGEQVRYVPVFMISNPVSLLNPYYVKLGIAEKLRKDTKFLRGPGYVLEQGYLESVGDAQKASGFNMAFASDPYIQYAAESVYLNDNETFIETPKGSGRYLATIIYEGKNYCLREFAKDGIIYCDNHVDLTYPFKISVTTEDHNTNYVMMQRNDLFIKTMRWYFEKGCFRFKDLNCKNALLKLISF